MSARGIAIILAALAGTGCASDDAMHAVRDAALRDMESQAAEERAHRDAMADYCRIVLEPLGPGARCIAAPGNRLVPGPDAPPMPVYTEACGYLPPVYGDDC